MNLPQLDIVKFPVAKAHLSLFIEGEQAILFNDCHQALYQLSPLSIALLLADKALDASLDIAELAQSFGLPVVQVDQAYQHLLELCSTTRTSSSYKDGRYPELDQPVPPLNKATQTYIVAGTRYAITTQSTFFEQEINALLQPCHHICDKVDVSFEIYKAAQGYEIIANGLPIASELGEREVMPLVIDHLQILSFQRQAYSFCFHGAAVKTPQGTLLLPGKSGAGKSTLCAHLADQSSELLSDELIVFDCEFKLLDLPLPIAIKSGSWPLFAERYPKLESATEWQRRDGRRLKYVWPTQSKLNRASQPKRFLLVNPQFCEAMKNDEVLPKMRSLSVIETLTVLTQGGYQVGEELNEHRLTELIDFLSQIPCYQLSYQSTEQAMQALDKLWS